jgi:hypothetical protein
MAAAHNKNAQTGSADPMIQKIAQEDPIPWYKKPNLRYLYILLFPTCMAMELTSGFDGQMVNALQIVPAWVDCTRQSSQFASESKLTQSQILLMDPTAN